MVSANNTDKTCKTVYVDTIIFKGKRNIAWSAVKDYLKIYVGNVYEIEETKDLVHIANDFPNEFSGSKYTYTLKGAAAKAKANAAQAIPFIVKYAVGKHYRQNSGEKHINNAKNGWYRYDCRFAIPVLDYADKVERYNIYHASLLVRHDKNGKLYLYDLIDIKKETGNPLKS